MSRIPPDSSHDNKHASAVNRDRTASHKKETGHIRDVPGLPALVSFISAFMNDPGVTPAGKDELQNVLTGIENNNPQLVLHSINSFMTLHKAPYSFEQPLYVKLFTNLVIRVSNIIDGTHHKDPYTDFDLTNRFTIRLEKEEGLLKEPRAAVEKYNLWEAALEAEGVAKAERPAHIVAFKHIIGYRIVGRPRWNDVNNSDNLKALTALAFLRHVHKDDIIDGHVYKETIRASDPDLMKAVESYISQRERRNRDLGEASGLVFVVSKAATNKSGREPERVPPSRRVAQRHNRL